MNFVNSIGEALIISFEILFRDIIIYLPKIFLAFIILATLIWVSGVVSRLIGDLLRLIKIDNLLGRIGVTQAFHAVGFQVSIAYAVQTLLRWLLNLLAILSALAILGLNEIVYFIEFGLFQILPNVAILAIMLFLTIVAANKLRDLTLHSSYVARNHSPFLGNIVWLLVIIFGTLVTLEQLEILTFLTDSAAGIIQALALGAALALGLSFGLGAKEEARCLVRSWMGKDCYDLECGCNTWSETTNEHSHDCDCDSCEVK